MIAALLWLAVAVTPPPTAVLPDGTVIQIEGSRLDLDANRLYLLPRDAIFTGGFE